jgi:hypothetical protein
MESLENRCLLSAAAVAIPSGVVGQSFAGAVHLRYHAERGVKAHSSAGPVTVVVDSLSDGTLSGTISASSAGGVDFSGPTNRRSFDGIFADGKITGKFNAKATALNGSVREVVNGELITGHYTAKDQAAIAAKSPKRKSAQTSSSSSTGVTTAGAGAATSTTSAAFSSSFFGPSAPSEPISLPALETSFIDPSTLNGTTTSAGVAGSGAALGSEISGPQSPVGSQIATPGVNMTNNGGSGNSTFLFSSSSGIVSVTSSGNTFTASSGIVSITAPPNYTPSSGIAPVTGLGT